MKAELAMHDALSGKSHVQYEPYTDAQRAELNLTLRRYMNEEIEDIEVCSILFPLPGALVPEESIINPQ